MDPADVLRDERFCVVSVPPASAGVAWLRSEVARFSEGAVHVRRRRIVESILSSVEPADLVRPGDHVAVLAEALGLPASLAADVRLVAACYQPHTTITSDADDAVGRLVDQCGGTWDETTANLIGVLVQACDATANLIAGMSPPVPATRRIDPDGNEITVDLTDHPFGAGRHECPGRRHALALAEGAAACRREH
jgi:hypothetical protein